MSGDCMENQHETEVEIRSSEEGQRLVGRIEDGCSWGSCAELLLVSAVKKHGNVDWDLISLELKARAMFLNISPARFSAQACKVKYNVLQGQYASTSSGGDGGGRLSRDGGDVANMAWFEELRKLRMAHLKRELQQYEGSIGSLEAKVKRLKAERAKVVPGSKRSDANLGRSEQKDRLHPDVCGPSVFGGDLLGQGHKSNGKALRHRELSSQRERTWRVDVDVSTSSQPCKSGDRQGLVLDHGLSLPSEKISKFMIDDTTVTGDANLEETNDISNLRDANEEGPGVNVAIVARNVREHEITGAQAGTSSGLCPGIDVQVKGLTCSSIGDGSSELNHEDSVFPDIKNQCVHSRLETSPALAASSRHTLSDFHSLPTEKKLDISGSPKYQLTACAVEDGSGSNPITADSDEQHIRVGLEGASSMKESADQGILETGAQERKQVEPSNPKGLTVRDDESSRKETAMQNSHVVDAGPKAESTGQLTMSKGDFDLTQKDILAKKDSRKFKSKVERIFEEKQSLECTHDDHSHKRNLEERICTQSDLRYDGICEGQLPGKSSFATCTVELQRLSSSTESVLADSLPQVNTEELHEHLLLERLGSSMGTDVFLEDTQAFSVKARKDRSIVLGHPKEASLKAIDAGISPCTSAGGEHSGGKETAEKDFARIGKAPTFNDTNSEKASQSTPEPNNLSEVNQQAIRESSDNQIDRGELGSPSDGVDDSWPVGRRSRRESKVSGKLVPLLDCMRVIYAHKSAPYFKQNHDSQDSNNYHLVIKRHVDLGTIRARLEAGAYSGSLEFFRDLLLIFTNHLVCKPSGSQEFVAAKELRNCVVFEMRKTFQAEALLKQDRPATRRRDVKKLKEMHKIRCSSVTEPEVRKKLCLKTPVKLQENGGPQDMDFDPYRNTREVASWDEQQGDRRSSTVSKEGKSKQEQEERDRLRRAKNLLAKGLAREVKDEFQGHSCRSGNGNGIEEVHSVNEAHGVGDASIALGNRTKSKDVECLHMEHKRSIKALSLKAQCRPAARNDFQTTSSSLHTTRYIRRGRDHQISGTKKHVRR